MLEDVHDPHNVSAVLRTCDAVGVGTVHMVYVTEEYPKLGKKSSASAWKWTDFVRHESIEACYKWLRERGVKIIATDLAERAVGLYELDLAGPVALVFGNEHKGVSPEASKDVLVKRQFEMTNSFLGGACAMVVGGPWELQRMNKDAKFEWRVAKLPVREGKNIEASALRQKVSLRHAGSERFADSPSIFSPSQRAPGTLLRRLKSHGTRLAACA